MTTSRTTTGSASGMPDLAHTIREQLLAAVKQGQQLSVQAARTWVDAVAALPVPDLPTVPGARAVPSGQAAAVYSLGLAADLLESQRQFALQMAGVLAPRQRV